jgi:hypothetical protein
MGKLLVSDIIHSGTRLRITFIVVDLTAHEWKFIILYTILRIHVKEKLLYREEHSGLESDQRAFSRSGAAPSIVLPHGIKKRSSGMRRSLPCQWFAPECRGWAFRGSSGVSVVAASLVGPLRGESRLRTYAHKGGQSPRIDAIHPT